MERARRRRPSPALLIACLALFVALGGTVLAATKIDGRTIRVKSLPGNRLEVGSLPGNRLRPGTIPGNRIAPRSLKGDRIDTATLGQVASAAHADSADAARHAETAIAADHAADATTVNGRSVGCAADQRQFAGACWDMAPRTNTATATEAVTACAAEGGELPAGFSLIMFIRQPGMSLGSAGEWTNQVSAPNPPDVGLMVLEADGTYVGRVASTERQFRCVTPLLG